MGRMNTSAGGLAADKAGGSSRARPPLALAWHTQYPLRAKGASGSRLAQVGDQRQKRVFPSHRRGLPRLGWVRMMTDLAPSGRPTGFRNVLSRPV